MKERGEREILGTGARGGKRGKGEQTNIFLDEPAAAEAEEEEEEGCRGAFG